MIDTRKLCEPSPKPPMSGRLVVSRAEYGLPSVKLDGVELAGMLASDGLRIAWEEFGDQSLPVVTMTFGPGFLEVDLDLLVADAEAAKR